MHLLLDLSIGSLHNYLLPSSGGGSGVLLHGLLLSQPSRIFAVRFPSLSSLMLPMKAISMLLPLNMEVMIIRYARLVWHRLPTPPLC